MSATEQPIYLADHPLLYAIPVLIPTFIVVGIVALVIIRDRKRNGKD